MSHWPSYASNRSTDSRWVLQRVRSWGWITTLPASVVVAEAETAPLCAVEVQNGLSQTQLAGCNPLSPPNLRAPRAYCLAELRRVGQQIDAEAGTIENVIEYAPASWLPLDAISAADDRVQQRVCLTYEVERGTRCVWSSTLSVSPAPSMSAHSFLRQSYRSRPW